MESGPPEQLDDRRATALTGVSLYGELLICSLADGRLLCVPIATSPALQAAPSLERFQWQVVNEGHAVAWRSAHLDVTLSVETLTRDPRATFLAHVPAALESASHLLPLEQVSLATTVPRSE